MDLDLEVEGLGGRLRLDRALDVCWLSLLVDNFHAMRPLPSLTHCQEQRTANIFAKRSLMPRLGQALTMSGVNGLQPVQPHRVLEGCYTATDFMV